MAPMGPTCVAEAGGSSKVPRKGPMWLARCLFPFAGSRPRHHSVHSASPLQDVSDISREKATSSSCPRPQAGVPIKREAFVEAAPPVSVSSPVATVNKQHESTTPLAPPDSEGINAPQRLADGTRIDAASSTSSAVVQGDDSSRPENVLIASHVPPLSSADGLSSTVAAAEAKNRKEVLKDISDKGILPPPPMQSSPPPPGASAGAPASELPSWWIGKDPVPMELLEEDDKEVVGDPEADNLLPPLPSLQASRRAIEEFALPALKESASTTDRCEAPDCQPAPAPEFRPLPAPELRPRSYRNSGRLQCRSSSPGLKSDKAGRTVSASSSFSRPTTADVESGPSGPSTFSTSWRQEWTPGNEPCLERHAGVVLKPLPSGVVSKPPALPPLPMKPPESGSVFGVSGANDIRTASPQPFLTKNDWSDNASIISVESGSTAAAPDAAALRRIIMSGNVKAATPPPIAKRKNGDAPSRDNSATVKMEEAAEDLAVSACVEEPQVAAVEGSADEGAAADKSSQKGFSELARAFTCMGEA